MLFSVYVLPPYADVCMSIVLISVKSSVLIQFTFCHESGTRNDVNEVASTAYRRYLWKRFLKAGDFSTLILGYVICVWKS